MIGCKSVGNKDAWGVKFYETTYALYSVINACAVFVITRKMDQGVEYSECTLECHPCLLHYAAICCNGLRHTAYLLYRPTLERYL